ncbi:2-keto-4-pentenoate hydratase/2-oxohepta-3-ene-1,7-dioic acid hydratase in catechol pathway [Aliiruegeria haliotis]|uniref:2-keto-4-pentenoate hydratase/2-oxohepta-3-ene-1,7-dioic acid hydratase in catechol pathway n=1 Tax=Aliiruegeria haliotis TaxID=1280846 RepID=A0A2T0RY48_9RHOB|nr:fumarylacetoacetate hydrolase family protein [Aliiruegeria haliotis]PRY26109.1 2-keto-4-pentenoate hydratase/2-oxohepta-3-ene-1,7-dioic acid hydratase in catechol pathway [Aliiruegeria haliotis]
MRFRVGKSSAGFGVHLVDGTSAVNISALDPAVGSDLMGLIRGDVGIAELSNAIAGAAKVSPASIVPALPVADPGKVICLGLNYVDHIKEGGYEIPEYPALFMRGRNSLMAADAPMVRPTCSERLDYEVELMVIIGKGGRHISEEDALDHVFGYTVFNDGSVRDYQRKTHQWTPGKNFDDTGAIGPDVVTPDELPEGCVGLKIESRVGDEILQSANTSDMLWSVARTIATISEYSTLDAGDMIAMGTPPGVGHARTPPRWLRPGEVVEAEIEGIGICANPIVAEEDLATTEAAE